MGLKLALEPDFALMVLAVWARAAAARMGHAALLAAGCALAQHARSKFGAAAFHRRQQSIKRMVANISEVTDRSTGWLDAAEVVGRLNRKLTGWANYFCLGPVSPAYRAIDTHTRQWLRRWLFRKHKIAGTGTSRFPGQYL